MTSASTWSFTKTATAWKPRGQYCRVGTKQRLKIDNLMFVTSIKLIEQSAFVILCSKHCDPHAYLLQEDAFLMRGNGSGCHRLGTIIFAQ
jgi:hypothetical protein